LYQFISAPIYFTASAAAPASHIVADNIRTNLFYRIRRSPCFEQIPSDGRKLRTSRNQLLCRRHIIGDVLLFAWKRTFRGFFFQKNLKIATWFFLSGGILDVSLLQVTTVTLTVTSTFLHP
jgi:hypothetical protein